MKFFSDRNILVALVLLQTLLCVFTLDKFPISLDEPFSIFHSQQDLKDLFPLFETENNPPLHFVLLHFWIKMFGVGVFAVRSLSILISLISIICLYKLGRKFWKKEYAALLVGLFIFSRLNHYVAIEARMYGLFTLFFILVLSSFYSFLIENKRNFIWLGVWNAFLLYSHYLGGIVILMEGLVFLFFFSSISKQKVLHGLLAVGIGGVLYIPGIRIFMNRAADFKTNGSWVAPAKMEDLWVNLVKLLNNEFTLIASVVVLIISIIASQYKKEEKDGKILSYIGIWFLGSYLLMFIVSLTFQPLFIAKYLQFITIPLLLFIVALVAKRTYVGWKRILPFFILIPFFFSFKPIPEVNRNTDELMDYVKSNRLGDPVFYCPPHYSLTLAYHYDLSLFEDYRNMHERMSYLGYTSVYDASEIEQSASNRLIYIDFDSKMLYPDNEILTFLMAHYNHYSVEGFKGDFAVYIFEHWKAYDFDAIQLPMSDSLNTGNNR